jgi:hypothetical protein
MNTYLLLNGVNNATVCVSRVEGLCCRYMLSPQVRTAQLLADVHDALGNEQPAADARRQVEAKLKLISVGTNAALQACQLLSVSPHM